MRQTGSIEKPMQEVNPAWACFFSCSKEGDCGPQTGESVSGSIENQFLKISFRKSVSGCTRDQSSEISL